MNIKECERQAVEMDCFNSGTFEIFSPAKQEWLKAKWLDAYFGFFTVEGTNGFVQSNDFTFLECRNLKVNHEESF